jgi:cell shape-determining protein MreC
VPAGLVLGDVESFADADRRGDWEAVLRPLRDLDALETVFVLRRAPLPRQLRPR